MIFLGCLYDKKQEKELLALSKNGLQNAVNTFQWNIIDGLLENNQKLSILNALPVGPYPTAFKKPFLPTKKWRYKNCDCCSIGCINLPIIKQFLRYKKTLKKISSIPDKNIIIGLTYSPFLRAISRLPKDYNVTLIVQDLPEFYTYANPSRLWKIFRKINSHKEQAYLKRIDNFILITENMKNCLPIDKKPYDVIEGIATITPDKNKNDNYAEIKNYILYAGNYRLDNNIEKLLKAFNSLNTCYKLVFCGNGEANNIINQYSAKNNKIINLGSKPREEILKLEKEAKLLINPRMNNEEYTKYSFPSKTMEYLASGTPVLMYKLDGIPKEYDNYIYYIKGNSVNDLKESIESTCAKPQAELTNFGKKAQEWVLKNKNPKVQTKKILNLLHAIK